MATRGLIAREVSKDELECIYSHWDNYLEYNGVILSEHYDSKERVEELFAQKRDVVFLAPTVRKTSFYSGSEGGAIKLKYSELESYAKQCFAEFIYVFTLKERWKFKKRKKLVPSSDGSHEILWSGFKNLDVAIKTLKKSA